jgi:uncharacterized membrane protein YfcA
MDSLVVAAVLSVPIGLMLGLLGGGGSILTVPLLVYGLGLPGKEAIATSLLVVVVASSVAAAPQAARGWVRWRTAAGFAAMAMVGAFGGGHVAQFVPSSVLLLLFAAMMIVTSVAMWRGRRAVAAPDDPPRTKAAKVVAEGLTVGFLTGLVGAGGGFLVVPALVLVGGLTMREAVGTSLVVIAANSLAGFAGHVSHVTIDYQLAAVVVTAASAGALFGSLLSTRVSQPHLRRGFAVLVAAMGAYILAREVPPQLSTNTETVGIVAAPTRASA